MKRIKGLVAISAFALLVLGLPAVASAQWNGGYGNGGYYGNNANVRSAVKRLKDKAKQFEKSVDRYDDRNDNRGNRGGWGNWGGYNNSDSLERLSDQFKKAADDLEDAYGRGRNMNNSADEARRVLNLASAIDQHIYNARGGRNLQGQWNSMRQELNIIAGAYGYNNGYPNRNNRRGGRGINFPF